jgi:hypothetical protein
VAGHDVDAAGGVRLGGVAVDERADGALEVLRRREGDEEDAEDLPALEDALGRGIARELLHDLAVELIADVAVRDARAEQPALLLEQRRALVGVQVRHRRVHRGVRGAAATAATAATATRTVASATLAFAVAHEPLKHAKRLHRVLMPRAIKLQ